MHQESGRAENPPRQFSSRRRADVSRQLERAILQSRISGRGVEGLPSASQPYVFPDRCGLGLAQREMINI
jgi:hypothetical protein